MKVLVASIVRQNPEVLKAALQTWKWQTGKFEVDYLFIDDNDNEESRILLHETDLDAPHATSIWFANPKPEGARYAVNDATHDWSVPTFHWLAQEKQRILDYAKANHYDAIWIVDSDLLCAPDTLSSLLNTRKDVVSAVFWTKWVPNAPPLPQVWLAHPYELQGRGVEAHEFLGLLAARGLVRVAGLGACTLIRAGVLDKVAYWPLVENLPTHGMWQGEDRHFCVRAERNHVELWADAWPDVWHCYRPEDRKELKLRLDKLSEWRFQFPRAWYASEKEVDPQVGDLVSFTLEPLEEMYRDPGTGMTKALPPQHVRGRLGAIKVLPQIERALTEMRAGDERLLRVAFPRWWHNPGQRGQAKLIRITLHSVKPFAEPPTLAESEVAAQNIGETFMQQEAA